MNSNYKKLTQEECSEHLHTARRNNNLRPIRNRDPFSTVSWNDDLRVLHDEEMVELRNLQEQNVSGMLLDGTLIYNEDQPVMDIDGEVEEDTPMDIESEVECDVDAINVDGYDVGEVVGNVTIINVVDDVNVGDVDAINVDDVVDGYDVGEVVGDVTIINVVDGDDVGDVDAINVDDVVDGYDVGEVVGDVTIINVVDGDDVGDVGEVEIEAEHILDDKDEFILDEDDAFIDNDIEEEEVAANNQDETIPPTQIELTTRPKCRHLNVQRTILERSHRNQLIHPDCSSMNENEQKLANVGFSEENINMVKLLQERKKSSCAETELFIEYLEWSLQVIIRASTDNIEEAYENAVEHRRKLCELVSDVDAEHGSNYRSRLNLGSFPSKEFQVLCTGNYAPKECMKYVDVKNETNPLTRANKVDTNNACIRMIYNIIPTSMMKESSVEQTSENFEKDRDYVLETMFKRICFIDRSIICSVNKKEYLQEIHTFCFVMGIPFQYYHLIPALCIAFQAILSNASQKKAITVMAMGASAIKNIRGTIPVRTSTSCVRDGGGILHTENAWNRKHLGSRYCYPTQLLQCYDKNLQFFYTNIEEFNLFIDNYQNLNDDYITTILRRWGGAVGSPQTAAELNDLKTQMYWLYGGIGMTKPQKERKYGSNNMTPLQKEMQGVCGYHTENMTAHQKEMQNSRGYNTENLTAHQKEMQNSRGYNTENLTAHQKEMQNSRGYNSENMTPHQIEMKEQYHFTQPIEGLHATLERESLYKAAVIAGSAPPTTKTNCVVCAYELLHSKEKMEIIWNRIKSPKTRTIFDIIYKSEYSFYTHGGCVKCGIHLCPEHFKTFDHSDEENVKYRDIIFPKGKIGWAIYCDEDELNFWDQNNTKEIQWHSSYYRLKAYVDINVLKIQFHLQYSTTRQSIH